MKMDEYIANLLQETEEKIREEYKTLEGQEEKLEFLLLKLLAYNRAVLEKLIKFTGMR